MWIIKIPRYIYNIYRIFQKMVRRITCGFSMLLGFLGKRISNKKIYLDFEWGIEDLREFIHLVLKIPGLEQVLVSRKLAKRPIMTIPYGSTLKVRSQQMLENYKEYCYQNGLVFTNQDLMKLDFVWVAVDKLFQQ